MSKKPGRRSVKREPKKVIEERNFRRTKADEGWKTSPFGDGYSPQYLSYMQSLLGERVEEQKAAAEISPEVKALADELMVVHLPDWYRGDRKVAEATRVEIHQAVRLAQYLVEDRGCSGPDPDKERRRWVPTPNAGPADMGIHVERNPDGTWPTPDPEDFYDLEKLTVSRSQNGWIASHPCGVKAEATTKSAAHADAVAQLMAKIEAARASNEEAEGE